MTKENTQQKDLIGIEALLKELFEILTKRKQVVAKTNTLLIKVHQHYLKYHDSNIFRKVFFEKVNGICAYISLGLKSYYEDHGVCFLYNANKDSLKVFGDIAQVKESFLEYKERIAKEKQSQLESETKQQKIEKTLQGLYKRYSIDDLKALNEILTKQLKKEI